ncbi:MAG: helix-turn-helix transcriptional regulator [Oscillospiraceae bacterium]
MYYESIILSHLMSGPVYGYELKKAMLKFNRTINGAEINNNSLYPLLTKYETNGYVTKTMQIQEGRPNRNVYEITEKGKIYFYRLVNDVSKKTYMSQQETCVRLYFFDVLTPVNRKKLLDGREEFLNNAFQTPEKIMSDEADWLAMPRYGVNPALTRAGLLVFYNNLNQLEMDLLKDYRTYIDAPCCIPEVYLQFVEN